MAVEDAAALGNILSHISHLSQLTPMLRAYEGLRHARTSATQASSRLNQKSLGVTNRIWLILLAFVALVFFTPT